LTVAKSGGPNYNALTYTERAVSTGLVDISQLTVVVSGPKFTQLFCSMREKW